MKKQIKSVKCENLKHCLNVPIGKFTCIVFWLTAITLMNGTMGCSFEKSLLIQSSGKDLECKAMKINGEDNADSFNVLSWNLYMRPAALFDNGQMTRARLIPDYVANYDAIIFSEAFDDRAREELIEKLVGRFPYYTSIIGSDRWIQQDGGVFIMSRFPIQMEAQTTFGSNCSGGDCLADKGVIYALISKYGQRYHVFGTHTQAHTGDSDIRMRKEQFTIIRDFVTSFNIPSNEAVLIGGDMNVDRIKYSGEYSEMLNILEAEQPERTGYDYSYDHRTNKLATENAQEYLDYVLYSKRHLKPSVATNEVVFMKTSQPWTESGEDFICRDLSDHYPLFGSFRFESISVQADHYVTLEKHNGK